MNKVSLDWVALLYNLTANGSEVESREGTTLELLNQSLVYPIHDCDIQIPERNISTSFVAQEADFAISGAIEPNTPLLKKVLKTWINEFGIYSGSYGPQFLGQLSYILELLKIDPKSRQAVMTIWKENPRPQRNVPCLTQLHFLMRRNKLNCFATMRSSDAWLGLPNDVGVFALMAAYVAERLDMETGTMYLNMHSSHLYDRDRDNAEDIVKMYKEML